MRSKLQFENAEGHQLAGLLETPSEPYRAVVLFAHCFTCGKDVAAASRISRFLVQHRFAVFRFDFTGLGNSDGDFANANFSSNVTDLLAAADFLESHLDAPSLLIGHSLGGAAVLLAANQLENVQGVVTIGAPFEADHVLHNFQAHVSDIEEKGECEVTLGLRQFNIKKQFIDDVRAQTTDHISSLKKALLVMHSPVDLTVDVSEAEKIYRAAKHPKSFVSLDTADHLLSKTPDSEYVAETIAGWASRYIEDQSQTTRPAVDKGHVAVSELDHKFQQIVYTDTHHWYADEPRQMGGQDTGPDPYEHLLAALGTCTAMTIRMYANHKKLPLEHVEVYLTHSRDYVKDCEQGEPMEALHRTIQLKGDLTNEQKARLMEIADRCPVHKTLHANPQVVTELKD